jgi:hypothetical protein
MRVDGGNNGNALSVNKRVTALLQLLQKLENLAVQGRTFFPSFRIAVKRFKEFLTK